MDMRSPRMPRGIAGAVKATRSLALYIRDGVDPAELRDRLLSMARGCDPVTNEKCTVLDQQRAIQMLFDRGWGQAAQHVVIEGEIRTELLGAANLIVKPNRTLEQIELRRRELLAAGVKRKIIEATAIEHPKEIDADDE
jgi:hypothetical protein